MNCKISEAESPQSNLITVKKEKIRMPNLSLLMQLLCRHTAAANFTRFEIEFGNFIEKNPFLRPRPLLN